jgi:hypothetical protein
LGGSKKELRKLSRRYGNPQNAGLDIIDLGEIPIRALWQPLPSVVGPPNTAIRNGGGMCIVAFEDKL